MKRWLKVLVASLGLAGCHSLPRPAVPLRYFDYIEPPHIVRRGAEYFLRYQIDARGRMVNFHPPHVRTTPAKAHYYFGVPVSANDPGDVHERSLARDGITDYARRDAVYWLDPNGTETHLEIVDETRPANR
ncbi:hypothetical protein WME76_22455 [Sorangium sp. So ce119]|uniref:hypothetical protein n=1 Tax=Sorangium sp. So ce119 TaxID=3133279 RepID=UPI003F643CA8